MGLRDAHGMSSRGCSPAPSVVLDGLDMLEFKQTRTGEARGEGNRGMNPWNTIDSPALPD